MGGERTSGVRLLFAVGAVLALAMGLTACAPLRPVVRMWGDSLTVEAESSIRFQVGDAYDLRISAMGGSALCDFVSSIIDDAASDRPSLVLVQFSGNALTPCTQIDGEPPTNEERLARYRADAARLVGELRSLGVPLVFVGTPPLPSRGSFADTVDSVYAELTADAGGWATYLRSGAALAAPDGQWTATLPCMSFEGVDQGCVDGRIAVRSADRVHFCPGTTTFVDGAPATCSTWSSGAWRYAAWITAYLRLAVAGSPIGFLDVVAAGSGQVRVAGWAYDPQSGESPIAVHVYVDDVGYAVVADGSRPDVEAAFRYMGASHGFDGTFPASPGAHEVCAYGIDTGVGENVLLGCRSVVVVSSAPFGVVDEVVGGVGSVSVAGWAIDPDSSGPISVRVYIGTEGHALTADVVRPDVGAAFPEAGPVHGFAGTIPASPGTHLVCVQGIDVGPGDDSVLGCRTVVVGADRSTSTAIWTARLIGTSTIATSTESTALAVAA